MADPTDPTRYAADDERRTDPADLLAGGTFVALGLAFAVGASRYDVGSALQMGPGYLPLVLGVLLAVLGAGILVTGLLARRRPGAGAVAAPGPGAGADEDVREAAGPVPWVRGGLLIAAVVTFGLTVRGLGLGGALFLTTFLAALAGHRNSPLRAALIAAGLTAMCLIVFVALLQLRLPVVGTWLGG